MHRTRGRTDETTHHPTDQPPSSYIHKTRPDNPMSVFGKICVYKRMVLLNLWNFIPLPDDMENASTAAGAEQDRRWWWWCWWIAIELWSDRVNEEQCMNGYCADLFKCNQFFNLCLLVSGYTAIKSSSDLIFMYPKSDYNLFVLLEGRTYATSSCRSQKLFHSVLYCHCVCVQLETN